MVVGNEFMFKFPQRTFVYILNAVLCSTWNIPDLIECRIIYQ